MDSHMIVNQFFKGIVLSASLFCVGLIVPVAAFAGECVESACESYCAQKYPGETCKCGPEGYCVQS